MEVFGGDPLRVWSPAQILRLVGDQPPRFAPGTGWAYSNTDYVLTGMMIERATGRSLERELVERIVRPLGLHHTSFPVRQARLGRHAARGYSLDLDPGGRPVEDTLRDVTVYSPHGSLIGHDGDVSGFSIVARSDRGGRRQAVVAINVKFAPPAVDAAFDAAVDAAVQVAFGG
jgi:D-alanyl-D-alanine carboxypeptidase